MHLQSRLALERVLSIAKRSTSGAKWLPGISVRLSSNFPSMPPCDFKPEPYKGPSYDRALAVRKSNLTPGLITYYRKPVLLNQGHMQWLWDHTGKRYLDLIGGIVTVSVGHSHPKVVAALEDQSRRLWHSTNIFLHPGISEYAEKLASKMPGDLKVVYLVNSGSEANDLAMFLARQYTGRYDVISLQHAYHGASPYLMGLTALSSWRYSQPTGFGIHQTTNPDVFQGPWGGSKCRDSPVQTTRSCSCEEGRCEAEDRYIDALKDVIRFSIPKTGMAAFFAESIQGVGGTIQFPKNFLKRAFDLVRANGGICISDEVQTGFGRTGDHYWGFQGHGVQPDIVTLAKGIGNGFPMGAVVTTPEIARSLQQALYFNTFGGNPLACAVGSTVLDVLEEDKCQENSKIVGDVLFKELEALREEFEIVGDVRGKGLMTGIEFVKNKRTREPLPADQVASIWESTKDMGILVGKGGIAGNVFRIKPPMCVTKEDAKFGVDVIREAIKQNQS